MMIAKKGFEILLVISLFVIFGCGKENGKPKSFPQTYPEGLPREIVSENDGAEMILIPAGKFQMGDSSNERRPDIRPTHTVYLDAFYIDKCEVTNEQYARFLNAIGKNEDVAGHELLDLCISQERTKRKSSLNNKPLKHSNTLIFIGKKLDDFCLIEKIGNTYQPKPGYEKHPVIEVSWYGAAAYAQWAQKRLPTEAQWEKAARGSLVGKQYPWGDSEPDGSNANIADKNTNYDFSDKTIDDGYEHTAPVGSYTPNGYGLFDMAGNVLEWCVDEYDSGYYSNSPKNNPAGPGTPILFANNDFANVAPLSRRVVRGGSWLSININVQCAIRLGLNPMDSTSYVGFRCVVPAEDYTSRMLDKEVKPSRK